MGDVVNLRQARKQKARAEKEEQAQANRARHGRSKAERRQDAAEKALAASKLDAVKREPPERP